MGNICAGRLLPLYFGTPVMPDEVFLLCFFWIPASVNSPKLNWSDQIEQFDFFLLLFLTKKIVFCNVQSGFCLLRFVEWGMHGEIKVGERKKV